MNKVIVLDVDQWDRFFGGSDRVGKLILCCFLVVCFGCYFILLVLLVLIGMFSVLFFVDYMYQDVVVINYVGLLCMFIYWVVLEFSLEGCQVLFGIFGECFDSGDICCLL